MVVVIQLIYRMDGLIFIKDYEFLFFLDIDDCLLDFCYNGGICVDGINVYICVCVNGFYFGNNCCKLF